MKRVRCRGSDAMFAMGVPILRADGSYARRVRKGSRASLTCMCPRHVARRAKEAAAELAASRCRGERVLRMSRTRAAREQEPR
jgi:hypothetical protein